MTTLPLIRCKYHAPLQAPRVPDLTGPYLDPLSRRIAAELAGKSAARRGPDVQHRKRGSGVYARKAV